MNRPMAWVAAPFAAGIYLALGVGTGAEAFLPWAIALLGIVAALAAIAVRPEARRPLIVALMSLAAGAAWAAARTSGPPGDALCQAVLSGPTHLTLEGAVRRAALWNDERESLSAELVVDTVHRDGAAHALHGVTALQWRQPAHPLYPGDRVRLTGRVSPTIGTVNPGVMGFEDFARRRGVHSSVRVAGPYRLERVDEAPAWYLPSALAKLRESQARLFQYAVPDSARAFALTIWLGDRSGLDDALFDRYAAAGTAHILAVSGLHMGIVAISVMLLLKAAVKRPRLRALLAILIVFGFALMAGGRVSALRAATMFACYLFAELIDREPDVPSALALAAMIFLLISPTLLLEPGFQLSFLSVASILIFVKPVEQLFHKAPSALRRWADPSLQWRWADRVLPANPEPQHEDRPSTPRRLLATATAVQILPTPIAAGLFHVVPIAGPAINVLVVPLLTAALWLCLLTGVIGILFPDAALLFGHALVPVVWSIDTLSSMAANAPLGHARVTAPTSLAVAAFVLATLLAVTTVPWPRTMRWGMITALLVLAVIAWRPVSPQPMVAFLDVSDADATFIRTPGGETILIDGGLLSDFRDDGRRVIAPFLWGQGLNRVDTVIGTHAHADHLGGLYFVLDNFQVGELLLGPISTGTELEDGLLAIAEARGVPVRRVAMGESLPITGATLEVLYPPADIPSTTSLNDQSIVLRYEWDGVVTLLTGDIERPAEASIADTLGSQLRADVFKAPHHARNTSSSEPILQATQPRFVVVSSAHSERHPAVAPEVSERLAAYGVYLWRTDRHGAIVLTVVDGEARFDTARGLRGYPFMPPGPLSPALAAD